jgi:hypothetical protein
MAVMPNPPIERTAFGLRRPPAAHVKLKTSISENDDGLLRGAFGLPVTLSVFFT